MVDDYCDACYPCSDPDIEELDNGLEHCRTCGQTYDPYDC